MANNLFVSYDLIGTDRDYEPVTKAVKDLGNWGKLEYSYFYVNSGLSAEAAAKKVWTTMQAKDKLFALDASNNSFYCYNISETVLKHLQDQWTK